MKNYNKYTKAELISKFKELDFKKTNSNQSIFTKIFSYILFFKKLIIKITLITFLISWVKKYSLIRKIWHIISTIGSTLLGISLIDIYSLEFISWIKDTSIYKWYLGLFNDHKIDKVEDAIPSFMRTSNQDSTTNQNGNSESFQRSSKNFGWVNQQEVNDETPPFYYNKYSIIGALSLTTLISWYYF